MKNECKICGYIYDDAKEKIPYADLPANWHCPICGARKVKSEIFNREFNREKDTVTKQKSTPIGGLSVGGTKPFDDVVLEHEKTNIVAEIFTWMAWIILVGGFVFGIVMGRQVDMAEMMKIPTGDSFCFVLAFFTWLASSISAMPFFGFAEIIKLLEKIKNK